MRRAAVKKNHIAPGRVEINRLTPAPISAVWIKKILSRVGRLDKKLIAGGVEVNIVDDRTMRRLNLKWRGYNRTTDVLSFAWREEKSFKGDYLGQIYLSAPQIKRQAEELKIGFKEEFGRMLIHGLLHLAGYRHDRQPAAEKMFNKQETLLQRIKICR